METVSSFRDLYLATTLLTIFIYISLILYLFLFIQRGDELSGEERLVRDTLIATLLPILLLFTIALLYFQELESCSTTFSKLIFSSITLQLYLPMLLYTLQLFNNYFKKIGDVVTLTITVTALNLLFFYLFLSRGFDPSVLLLYLVAISTLLLLLFHCLLLSPSLKRMLDFREEGVLMAKEDAFLHIASSFALLSLTLLPFFGFQPLHLYLIRGTLTLCNIFLVFRLLMCNSTLSIQFGKSLGSPLNRMLLKGRGERGENSDLKRRLLSYFENEKPYLNSKLTINEVALYLYSNKTYISKLINEQFGTNFSNFVNLYRINYAQELFAENRKLTISELCDLSGFGSNATFNIAFKVAVGNSPAEWCREQRIKCHYEALETE